MIAAFLKTEDGDFAYGPAFGAVLFIGLAFIGAWILCRALTTGRIPFGYSGIGGSAILWIERQKNPGWFWFVFVVWSLITPVWVCFAYTLCTGFFNKAG